MMLLAYQHSVTCRTGKNGSKEHFSMFLWQLKKKRSQEKTSEKIQPKSNFKRQFMPIILIDFDWCHPRY